jgi:hypothetical protein
MNKPSSEIHQNSLSLCMPDTIPSEENPTVTDITRYRGNPFDTIPTDISTQVCSFLTGDRKTDTFDRTQYQTSVVALFYAVPGLWASLKLHLAFAVP